MNLRFPLAVLAFTLLARPATAAISVTADGTSFQRIPPSEELKMVLVFSPEPLLKQEIVGRTPPRQRAPLLLQETPARPNFFIRFFKRFDLGTPTIRFFGQRVR